MKFLEKLEFSKDEIAELEEIVPEKLMNMIIQQKRLISQNITYLKELGIPSYKEIFINYYDMFLMDNSNFIEVFSKYDKDDLLAKINQNIKIVEYL